MSTSDTIFGKIRLITLSNIHRLLDLVIDANDIAAVRQHLRDLRSASTELAGEAAEAEGRKRWIAGQIAGFEGEKKGIDAAILTILSDGNPDNDHLTKALGVKAVGLEKKLQILTDQLDEATRTDLAIDEALSQLDAKIASLAFQLEHLQSMENAAKAKEKAADALTAASGIAGQTNALNVDEITARIEQEALTADVKLEKALGSMNEAMDGDAQLAEAEAYLAGMKAKLGQ